MSECVGMPEPDILTGPGHEEYAEFVNRDLSWLQFARRVLELAQDPEVPLLERVKFAGIVGMLHDEFFMKRMSGLKGKVESGSEALSKGDRLPEETFAVCRKEILSQIAKLARITQNQIRLGLSDAGIAILDHDDLDEDQQREMAEYFAQSVHPILTPLAVDAEHPFPFISNLGINLAVNLLEKKGKKRFVRIKVPSNRDRWVPLSDASGIVPLEQVIAANLDQLFPGAQCDVTFFRVTRGTRSESNRSRSVDVPDGTELEPGSIIAQVTEELKARRFAGIVRLEVSGDTSKSMQQWLTRRLDIGPDDVYVTKNYLGIHNLLNLRFPASHPELHDPTHEPETHQRLRDATSSPAAIFWEIRKGEILLHHPYHCFGSSVVRFIESAAADPCVLAIKLTVYRTSTDSPIIQALVEAARQGKQVAVLVEITARFDEAPNIAWGRLLEREGAHVSYGVEKLKTHVKAALVVREEDDGIRRYVHVGTGNYHSGNARLYEDLGVLSCDPEISADVAAVFNELTSATPFGDYRKLLVAPHNMRERFVDLIRREAEHGKAGRPCGIRAKMNQLQDTQIIRELYKANEAGVAMSFNVRGLCCLRPGVPGMSENISVYSTLGRFLEHGRVYRFENGGAPELFLGSADWMKRNLNSRVETVMQVTAPELRKELDEILDIYEADNCSAWDMKPDGSYARRKPKKGEEPRPAQQIFMEMAGG